MNPFRILLPLASLIWLFIYYISYGAYLKGTFCQHKEVSHLNVNPLSTLLPFAPLIWLLIYYISYGTFLRGTFCQQKEVGHLSMNPLTTLLPLREFPKRYFLSAQRGKSLQCEPLQDPTPICSFNLATHLIISYMALP